MQNILKYNYILFLDGNVIFNFMMPSIQQKCMLLPCKYTQEYGVSHCKYWDWQPNNPGDFVEEIGERKMSA